MLKLVVVAALCLSKALGEPQLGDPSMSSNGPMYGAQPYPYAQPPMSYQQPPMMSQPPFMSQPPMMSYPMSYQPPMQPMGGYGGYPGSYNQMPSYVSAPAPSQGSQDGFTPVSAPVDLPDTAVNPETGVTVSDSSDGGLNWQQPDTSMQQPGLNWQQPDMGYQQPGLNWQQPGMSWQQPGLSWQQPAMNWQMPSWQQPGLNWQQPGLNWQPQPEPQPPINGTGYAPGPPNYGISYTPITSGCFNRCRPRCSLRPPMPPPPMPPPRPRPIYIPPPPPPPPKPQYGCRSVCRPMCNIQPSCGMNAPSWNGNTMMCGAKAPLYQQPQYPGYGGAYGNNMYNARAMPAAQPQVATQEPAEPVDSDASSEEEQ